jgi:hypothetical protein
MKILKRLTGILEDCNVRTRKPVLNGSIIKIISLRWQEYVLCSKKGQYYKYSLK